MESGYLLMMRNERVFGSFEGHEKEAGEPVSSFSPVIFAIKNSTISLFFCGRNLYQELIVSSSNAQIHFYIIELKPDNLTETKLNYIYLYRL